MSPVFETDFTVAYIMLNINALYKDKFWFTKTANLPYYYLNYCDDIHADIEITIIYVLKKLASVP